MDGLDVLHRGRLGAKNVEPLAVFDSPCRHAVEQVRVVVVVVGAWLGGALLVSVLRAL